MSTGAERIAAERTRQMLEKGYSPKHDDEYDCHELAWAAVCYAAPTRVYLQEDFGVSVSFADPWPWTVESDNRLRNEDDVPEPETASPEQRIELLTKAGALIAAEIDRLLRTKLESKP